jgi:protein-tyrosine phosphatase
MTDTVATPPDDRILTMDGILNFRDYGGYACAGGRLKRGLLFRSAQHRDASDEDLSRIAAIGFASVIDLRGGRERLKAPCRRPDGFAARILFTEAETAGMAPHIEAARAAAQDRPTAADTRQAMIDGYAGMPFRPYLLAMLRRYFDVLATVRGPSHVHCAAGKDRTGLAVALLHAAMGVHPDDILADYLLTNAHSRIDRQIETGARHVRATYGADLDDEAVRMVLQVDPAYVASALAAIDARYGSVDAYLADAIGVTPAKRDALAGQLVA